MPDNLGLLIIGALGLVALAVVAAMALNASGTALGPGRPPAMLPSGERWGVEYDNEGNVTGIVVRRLPSG